MGIPLTVNLIWNCIWNAIFEVSNEHSLDQLDRKNSCTDFMCFTHCFQSQMIAFVNYSMQVPYDFIFTFLNTQRNLIHLGILLDLHPVINCIVNYCFEVTHVIDIDLLHISNCS